MKGSEKIKVKKTRIITLENKLLRTVSQEVKNIDKHILHIADQMTLALQEYSGVGLAAIQLGIVKRMILIDLTEHVKKDDLIKPLKTFIINPIIKSSSEREEIDIEGCLSIPEVHDKVKRKFWVEVEGYTLDGKLFQKKLYVLAARVVQHEIDHLNGTLFIDKIEKEPTIHSH